jgi:hypothetical protein
LTDWKNQVAWIGNSDWPGIEKHQRFGKAKSNGIGGCFQATEMTEGVPFLIERIRSVQPYIFLERTGRLRTNRRVDQIKPGAFYGSPQTILASQTVGDRA